MQLHNYRRYSVSTALIFTLTKYENVYGESSRQKLEKLRDITQAPAILPKLLLRLLSTNFNLEVSNLLSDTAHSVATSRLSLHLRHHISRRMLHNNHGFLATSSVLLVQGATLIPR